MPLAQIDGGIFDLKQNNALVGKLYVLRLGGAMPPNTYVEHWVTLPTYVRSASFSVNLVAQSATYQDMKNYLAQNANASVDVTERFVRS